MKCKDCKHFILRESLVDFPVHFCNLTMTCDGKPYYRTLAYAEDREDYFAVLIVSHEFGCVQFEQRVIS